MPVRRALFFLLALAGIASGAMAQPAASAERGRAIYENGLDAGDRPLTAWTGAGRTPLPAAFVACANCHATDGRGKSEGGVTAPDIRWDTLDKPYGATRSDGRRRPAYAEETFHAAITEGHDSAGQGLDPAMPRYTLSAEQTADLTAYLREIGRGAVPGMTDDAIRLGVIVPAGEAAKERADLGVRVLRAWADEVNRAGGVYRRQLQVTVLADPPSEDEAAAVFAVISGADSDADDGVAVALARRGVPVLVGGRAVGTVGERRLFGLYPSVVDEARALVRHAVAHREAGATRVAIVATRETPKTWNLAAIAAAVASLPGVTAEPEVRIVGHDDSAVKALIRDRPDVVLWLGDAAAPRTLATHAATQDWRPVTLLAGARGASPPPTGSWVARATLPRDVLPVALAGYQEFARRHGLPGSQLSFQFALLASAGLFAEALDNAGRELNREKFVRVLETLADIKTGLTPPAGFSSRRHTAAGGMYVVPADAPEGSELGEWVRTD